MKTNSNIEFSRLAFSPEEVEAGYFAQFVTMLAKMGNHIMHVWNDSYCTVVDYAYSFGDDDLHYELNDDEYVTAPASCVDWEKVEKYKNGRQIVEG